MWRIFVALSALAASCAPEGPAPVKAGPAQAAAPREPAAAPVRAPRARSDELDRLRRAIELGDVAAARPLLAHAAPDEQRLLRARIAILEGEAVLAMRLLEEAKSAAPRDPDTWATAAEVYAARGAFDTAWEELRRGSELVGEPPEILRAKGVCWLGRQGGAQRGLENLLAARAADPALPFCDRALSQAHMLAGKEFARAEKLPEALASARAAVAHDPDEPDTRRFLADMLAGVGEFDEALAELAALEQAGEPLGAEIGLMEKRAGFGALLAGNRARAIEHFRRARERGLSDAELSSAAGILAEAAHAAVERGVAAWRASEFDAAERAYREALELDPENLAARNHLALARLRAGDPQEAAQLWRAVLEVARREQIELPEPVHVNLAQAELALGREAQARALLERYLTESPDGEWSAPTRELLARIDAEPR